MTKPQHSMIEQFAKQLTARLDEANADLSHDVSERLRAARERAVAARLVLAPQNQLQSAMGLNLQNGVGILHFGDEGLNLWSRIASVLPLIALVAGLLFVQNILDDDQADLLAEIDSALLTDDLPPAAYADPGFLQFLKLGDQFVASEEQD